MTVDFHKHSWSTAAAIAAVLDYVAAKVFWDGGCDGNARSLYHVRLFAFADNVPPSGPRQWVREFVSHGWMVVHAVYDIRLYPAAPYELLIMAP